jgi:PAS domain S-box-containing protein/putative nucleotidyltransferase with HDIG domain
MTSNKKILQEEKQLLFPNQYLVETASEKSPEKKTIQILIVEDSLEDNEILLFHLKKAGFIFKWTRVDTEDDYLKALSSPPDIILSDWKFPEFCGMRALELLNDSKLDVPFIIVSGSIGEEAAVEALHKGAYDYLMKDRPDRLGDVIRNALKQKLDNEKNRRIKEISFIQTSALNAASNPIVITDINGSIQWVNPAFSIMTGYSENEAIGKNPRVLLKSGLVKAEIYKIMWDTILGGAVWRGELINRKKDGQTYYEEQTITPVRNSDGIISQFIAIKQDITDRRRSEQALRESEERFKALIENSSDAITLLDTDGKTIYDSPAAPGMLGYGTKDWIGRNVFELLHPEDSSRSLGLFQYLIGTPGQRVATSFRVRHKNGSWVWLEMVATNLLSEPSVKAIVLNYSDITVRKQAEERLQISKERLLFATEGANLGVWNWDVVTGELIWSNQCKALFGIPLEETMSYPRFSDALIPDDRERTDIAVKDALDNHTDYEIEYRSLWPDGSIHWLAAKGRGYYDEVGKARRLEGVVLDITNRKEAEQMLQGQLEQLTSLRDIDQAILSSFDLDFNLEFILSKVTAQLGVDAADFLLFDPLTQTLKFAAGRGFHTKAIESTNLHIGESHAGKAALEQHVVHIPDLQEAITPLFTIKLDEEKFISFYAVPLIVKGKIKGVLELFHRSKLELGDDMLSFLNALAGQAAISIESASLYESQQSTFLELSLAYDATIEGWSHAMDLRDKETEGHTLRVKDLTLKLARAFGLNDAELTQVRWGALLHDIGKLGVPDAILLKPEPLSEEEWVLMKKHPTFAYEMLSPIQYLHLALDIPYCHHEKWDGSGYPQGLKGKQIPLSARIFMIVDVWDALRSDRPYRTAWPADKVRKYIINSSGSHFDPHVVDVFMQILK